jgi:hypothetical protein
METAAIGYRFDEVVAGGVRRHCTAGGEHGVPGSMRRLTAIAIAPSAWMDIIAVAFQSADVAANRGGRRS